MIYRNSLRAYRRASALVIYTAKVWPGANVVVFGLGGIGLNVIQAARMVGAAWIIGVDLNPGKAPAARPEDDQGDRSR